MRLAFHAFLAAALADPARSQLQTIPKRLRPSASSVEATDAPSGVGVRRMDEMSMSAPTGLQVEHIVNGDVQEKQAPYIFSMGRHSSESCSHRCSGTLIAPDVVLTTAACFTYIQETTGGFIDFKREKLDTPYSGPEAGVIRHIFGSNRVVRHPDYAYNPYEGPGIPPRNFSQDNNLALVFLDKPVCDIQPVKLNRDANVPANAGDPLDLYGWSDNPSSYSQPSTLTTNYITNDQCVNAIKEWARFSLEDQTMNQTITPNSLCATTEKPKGSCYSDHGAPLFHEGDAGSVLVAIQNFYDPCVSGRPTLYSRISTQIDWIEGTVCHRTGELCSKKNSKSGKASGSKCGNALGSKSSKALGSKSTKGSEVSMRRLRALSDEAEAGGRALGEESMSMAIESIIGGEKQESQKPYLFSLGTDTCSPKCNGVLIAPKIVLTTAACLANSDTGFIDINRERLDDAFSLATFNDVKDSEPGVIRYFFDVASNVTLHPEFELIGRNNNLALVFLDILPELAPDIEPLKLNRDPTVPAISGENLDVYGWVKEDTPSSSQFPDAQGDDDGLPGKLPVEYISNNECETIANSLPPNPNVIPARLMCAMAEVGSGVCIKGDLGSPLIYNDDILVGILSWKFKEFPTPPFGPGPPPTPKCDLGYPAVYTRMSEYTSWIEETACARTGDFCPASS